MKQAKNRRGKELFREMQVENARNGDELKRKIKWPNRQQMTAGQWCKINDWERN